MDKFKKAASQFGIPIVIVDREKVQESEKSKIGAMSEKLQGRPSSSEILKFVKKVEHYNSRYNKENIKEYAPDEKMEFLKKYAEDRKKEENANKATPVIHSIENVVMPEKEEILKKQNELKQANIISGGER